MKSNAIKVSIIIPVYNSEKYLRQCLDSATTQTLEDIEIICVNDGSTDESLKILEEYSKKDSRIKIISQENQGISVARNLGIKISTGEYIAFLDSDDYIVSDFCEKLYNRGIETNSDIVLCENVYSVQKRKIRLFLKVNKNLVTSSIQEKFECLYLPSFCYVWNKIYKRDIVKEGFIKEANYWEDIYFTCDVLARSNRLSVVADTAYYYRFNNNSVSRTPSNIHKCFYHRALAYFYDFVCTHNIDLDTSKYHEIKKYKFLGIPLFKTKRVFFKTQYYLFNVMLFSRISLYQ